MRASSSWLQQTGAFKPEQVVLTQQPVHSFRIDCPASPRQSGRNPGSSITGPLERDALNGIPQVHVSMGPSFASAIETVEAGPAYPAQLRYELDRQTAVKLHLLPRLCGRLRIFRECLQHPLFFHSLQAALQKIDLQCLLADVAPQVCNPAIGPSLLAVTRKRIAMRLMEFAPPSGARRSGLLPVRVRLPPWRRPAPDAQWPA